MPRFTRPPPTIAFVIPDQCPLPDVAGPVQVFEEARAQSHFAHCFRTRMGITPQRCQSNYTPLPT